MATKKEINNYLKQTGYTEADIQDFWNENINMSFIIASLNDHSKTWKDLDIARIEQLPMLKQTILAQIQEEKESKTEKDREKIKKQYYLDHFEEIMVQKIDNKEELTENELKELIWACEIDREEGENRR